jgi:hypothetical protein
MQSLSAQQINQANINFLKLVRRQREKFSESSWLRQSVCVGFGFCSGLFVSGIDARSHERETHGEDERVGYFHSALE